MDLSLYPPQSILGSVRSLSVDYQQFNDLSKSLDEQREGEDRCIEDVPDHA
jgi:hypothetical protein